jgi:alkylation response protein AidB-like acyl-CoA dehydrogenase
VRLQFSDDELAFQDQVRAWLDEVVPGLGQPPAIEDWVGRRRYDTAWQRVRQAASYGGVDWPEEFGGRGASPVEHLIFLMECERAHAPYGTANYVGLNHAGPTIMLEGTPEQKAHFLPGILRGDHVWCQGFSEPGAGSDLAAVRTRAVLEGDHYVVSGQKIWTSHSPVADYCELLVRTDPEAPRHRGISWLALPMDSPGVTVRPIRTIMGSSDFAEVFLDEVRVPVTHRIGPENDGWRVAMVTLSFERGTAFANELLGSLVLLEELATLCDELGVDDGVLRELGALTAEFDGLWALMRRNVSMAQHGTVPGLDASLFKLHFTEQRQQLAEFASGLLGNAALALDDLGEPLPGGRSTGWFVEERLRVLSLTIAGGTSEIQRNIIAERGLGMARG